MNAEEEAEEDDDTLAKVGMVLAAVIATIRAIQAWRKVLRSRDPEEA